MRVIYDIMSYKIVRWKEMEVGKLTFDEKFQIEMAIRARIKELNSRIEIYETRPADVIHVSRVEEWIKDCYGVLEKIS